MGLHGGRPMSVANSSKHPVLVKKEAVVKIEEGSESQCQNVFKSSTSTSIFFYGMDRDAPEDLGVWNHGRKMFLGLVLGWRWFLNTEGAANVREERSGGGVFGIVAEYTTDEAARIEKAYEGKRVLTEVRIRRVGFASGRRQWVGLEECCILYHDPGCTADIAPCCRQEHMKSMLTFFDEARKLEMPAWYWKLCLSQGISHPDDTLEELVRSRIVFSNTFEYEANGESQQCPGTTSDGPDPFMGFMGPEN